jgi:cleavage and polyadenylation specificity factor subunit 2
VPVQGRFSTRFLAATSLEVRRSQKPASSERARNMSTSGREVIFTPLAGARSDSAVCCYLLELEGCTLLLDCGWGADFNPEELASLAEAAPRVDAVLLSHADLAHVGALPYARARLGLRAPVYATIPVVKMAQMTLYDAHASAARHRNPMATAEDAMLFSLDDVHVALGAATELVFAQLTQLPGGVTISPHAAGHTIGGCVWRIAVGAEDILYAPEYNHQRERHLPAGSIEKIFLDKPSLLIAPARNALVAAEKAAAKSLTDYVTAALARGGDVMLPSDAAGRSLELVAVLEAHWRLHRELRGVPVVLLQAQAFNTIEFAKSEIEWMGDEAL